MLSNREEWEFKWNKLIFKDPKIKPSFSSHYIHHDCNTSLTGTVARWRTLGRVSNEHLHAKASRTFCTHGVGTLQNFVFPKVCCLKFWCLPYQIHSYSIRCCAIRQLWTTEWLLHTFLNCLSQCYRFMEREQWELLKTAIFSHLQTVPTEISFTTVISVHKEGI